MVRLRGCGTRQLLAIVVLFVIAWWVDPVATLDAPADNGDLVKTRQAHNNNWAVIVSTSRYWFNYRHNANALSLYHIVKKMGIPDSQIILMLAEDVACNARNKFPATVRNSPERPLNLYGEDDVEVDYRGADVSVASLLRLLAGKHGPDTPRSQRLQTDQHSNVLLYLSGHGGDEFLKFQDAEVMSAQDLADAISQMHSQRRYNNLLVMSDTCQAGTLAQRITAPGVVAIGSSSRGESAYSHSTDPDLGAAVIDRFTHAMLDFFERGLGAHASLHDLVSGEM